MNKTEERATKLIDTPKCLLVEVPEGARSFLIYKSILSFEHEIIETKGARTGVIGEIPLPPGSYGQPILASEITEEQARKLVQKVDLIVATHFKDYENKGVVKKALESFASLLRSHNLQPSNTVVIPKTI